MADPNNNKILAYSKAAPFSIDGLEEHLEPNVSQDFLVIYDSLNAQMKKIHPNALFSAGGLNGEQVTAVAHSLNVGDVVYLNSGVYTKAIADTAAHAEVIGMVASVVDVDTLIILNSGRITGLSGLTAGTVYFLSPTLAGAFTATEPVTATQISKPVLIADSTTSGYIIVNSRGKIIS